MKQYMSIIEVVVDSCVILQLTSLTSVNVHSDWLLHNAKNHVVCAFNSCMSVAKLVLSLK